jgi:hypothetical protein
MDDEQKIKIADQLSNWCNHCQLYAVKFFIWNTEPEQLETIIAEALDTLPGRVGPEEWFSALRSSLGQLPHCHLRDISTQIGLLLESPCKTDICLEECNKFRSKK